MTSRTAPWYTNGVPERSANFIFSSVCHEFDELVLMSLLAYSSKYSGGENIDNAARAESKKAITCHIYNSTRLVPFRTRKGAAEG